MTMKAIWSSIREPRVLKTIYFGVYAITLLTGIGTLLSPPTSISGELGPILTVIWSVAFIIGGTGGMLVIFPGWWWAERLVGVGFPLAGIAIYAFVVATLHFTSSGSRLTQFGTLMLAAALFVVRWVQIRGYSFEPRR